MKRRAFKKGTTLIEVLLASVILAITFFAIMSSLQFASSTLSRNSLKTQAMLFTNDKLEQIRINTNNTNAMTFINQKLGGMDHLDVLTNNDTGRPFTIRTVITKENYFPGNLTNILNGTVGVDPVATRFILKVYNGNTTSSDKLITSAGVVVGNF